MLLHTAGMEEVVGEGKTKSGNLLGVEIERPKPRGKLRPEQEQFLKEVNANGGLGLCVWSLDKLIQALEPYLT